MWEYNIKHDDFSQQCCVVYGKVVKRVNPQSSHHKEKLFSLFSSFFSLYCIWVLAEPIVGIISQYV